MFINNSVHNFVKRRQVFINYTISEGSMQLTVLQRVILYKLVQDAAV